VASRAPLLKALLAIVFVCGGVAAEENGAQVGWLSWRGPRQDGTSDEKNLPEKWTPDGENCLWVRELPGQSSPVFHNGRMFIMGWEGTGSDLQEGLYCLDPETGKTHWSVKHNDFLSDIIYTRYASSAPSIDAETGNVYMQGSQGILAAYSADGKLLWSHSLMEEFGRLTFPNGRTASPALFGRLVIASAITANWGAHGPAGHRFYAFDKLTGDLVWASQPGDRPRDSSFSAPVFGVWRNQRVFWCGGGDGAVYCVNADTGDPIWRYTISRGGLNATVLPYKDCIIAIHGSENWDSNSAGRMICIRPPAQLPAPQAPGQPSILDKSSEVWRNDLCAFTSSPIVVGNRIYQVDETADLYCVDAETGKILWKEDLGTYERTSSPFYADGKLFIPTFEGGFFIVKPGDDKCEVLSIVKLEGNCCGTPAAYAGRVYVQSTTKLYAIGSKQPSTPAKWSVPSLDAGPAGDAKKLLVVPAEIFARPGQKLTFNLQPVDANGRWLAPLKAELGQFELFIPPTARVRSMLKGAFLPDGTFHADPSPAPSAGAIKATFKDIQGTTRGRILPDLPIKEDFEGYALQPSETDPKVQFAYPPLSWIGGRLKWEVRERDGNKCFVKTIENKLFQRAFTFIGHADLSNYTIQADVMSDGVTRKAGDKVKIVKMSEVGVINQRYCIELKGPSQQLEINSNLERFQASVPFAWQPNVWYTLKTRVDIDANGIGTIRAKTWKKGDAEPEKWTIEAQHKTAHKNGAPGLFGFSPTDEPVYVDNVSVTKN